MASPEIAPWDTSSTAASAELAPWDTPAPLSVGTGALGALEDVGAGMVNTASSLVNAPLDIAESAVGDQGGPQIPAVPVGTSGKQVAQAAANLPVGGAESAGAMMGGPFGSGSLPPDVTPAAPTPGTVTAGQFKQGVVQGARQVQNKVAQYSPVAADVLGGAVRIGGDVLNTLPAVDLAGGATRGLVALGDTFDPASLYSHPEDMTPTEAPTKETPGPITAEQLQTGPDRLPPPPARAPAPAAPPEAAAATETPPARLPVPGKPHIRLKAAPDSAVTAAEAPKATAAADATIGKAEPAPLAAPATDEAEVAAGTTPSPAEQLSRQGAVQQLQADTGAVMPNIRNSAVTGDFRETGTDYQLGELGDPDMKLQLDQEQAALKAASSQQVQATGGVADGVEKPALLQRGQIIDRAMQGVGSWFDTNISRLYRGADGAASQRPMTLNPDPQAGVGAFHGILSDPSQFTGIEGRQLNQDIQQVGQQFGLIGGNGFWSPTTVENAERFRQWLGEQYTPRTGRVIGKLKDALDSDVAAAGGGGLYDQARALRFKRDQMLAGAKGIERMLPEKRPDGKVITRPVPVEDMADHLANLPTDEFNHVVNVLHDSSKLGNGELAADNAAALNEIRRHMAERLHAAGTKQRDGFWDAHAYHDTLNNYSTKLPAVFSPKGIDRFQTIHDAGNALKVNKRYGGAAKQIMQAQGVRARLAPKLAGAIEGAATGWLGPIGGAVGEATGLSGAIRKGVSRIVSGDSAAAQAERVAERVRPLGQRIPKQGGWIGDLRKSKLPVTEHSFDPESRTHTVTSENGVTHAQQRGNDIQVTDTQTAPEAAGKGEAVARMARLADEAHAQGGALQSDTSVSKDGQKVYPALAHLGYDIKPNPDVDLRNDGKLLSNDGRPVYSVGPPKRPPLRQGYDPAAALLDEQVKRDADVAHANPNGKRPPLRQEYDPADAIRESQAKEDASRPLAAKFPGQRGGPKFEPKKGEPESTLNIGLHVGDPANGGRVMKPQEALKAISDAGYNVGKTSVVNSNTEPTLVADIHGKRVSLDDLHALSAKLGQGAIAQRYNDASGSMEGPQAKDWGGEYNPAYFRMHDGKTAAEHDTTVTNPQRVSFPGIYDKPANILSRVETKPEDPILKQLFGVTRKDLHDVAVGRTSNMRYELPGAAAKPKGSKAAAGVMNDKNAQRLVDIINEAKKNPDLYHGMAGWYVMDPLFDKVVDTVGRKAAPATYSRLNSYMGMASPGSDVNTEINRGTAAHMMATQGKLDKFLKQGGRPMGSRGKPAELAAVQGHPYHSTAHGIPMRKYAETGSLQMESPKVPTYIAASGVPETGFQNHAAVGDSHWSRGVGLSDTRTNKNYAASGRNSEMQQLQPWYSDKVAKAVGLPSTSAQAVQWGALSHETGVETPVGAPKLELFAQQVRKAAARLKVTPEEALKRIILGTAHAG
jgi:hypothetical protein